MENLVLDKNFDIKVVDLGLAAKIESSHADGFLRGVIGTGGHQAPEILLKLPHSGLNADLFALGVIMFQMVCGAMAF